MSSLPLAPLDQVGVIAAESPMSEFLRDYLTVAIFAALAGGLLFVVLSLGKAVRPVRPQAEKYHSYESGVDAVGTGWAETPIRYYVFALLFVMFDVEVVFIFPWAVTFIDFPKYVFYEMLVFIGVLGLGLAYAWRRGVLEWGR